MCGIVGVFQPNEGQVEIETLKNMTDSIIHRGPDGEGQWTNIDKKVGFGHRRLSIIDLSEAGHQPMTILDRYTITFNGEIYNYLEIKEVLLNEGYQFVSNSDTEVLLALYDFKREKCLDDLDGMFAFAIWDEIEQELFCARDRFGEKPFHYFWDGNQFVFASEIKALFAGGIEQKINKKILQDFLDSYLVERGEETFFENIFKLKQSHYLKIRNNKFEIVKFYDIDLNKKSLKKNDEDYSKEFNRLLNESIERRLRSDVEIGSSLSGGLDSSSIVCLVNEKLNKKTKQKTFSARFHSDKDEGKWIKVVQERVDSEHHEIYPNIKDIKDEIEEIIFHHEYPIGSASVCAMWYVMKMVKDNKIRVLLDGQGADEYLSGYPIMKNFLLMEHLFHFRFQKFRKARKGYKKIYGKQYPLGKMLWAHPILKVFNHPKSAFKNAINFKQRLKYETFHRLQELLAYVDRNAMAFSIEVRLPFLYHELVEYGLSLPNEQLYNNGITKFVLRNAIKGYVPDEIVNRIDKIGYEPPQDLWLKDLFDENEVNVFLKANDYRIGSDKWRNFISTIFIKKFS